MSNNGMKSGSRTRRDEGQAAGGSLKATAVAGTLTPAAYFCTQPSMSAWKCGEPFRLSRS